MKSKMKKVKGQEYNAKDTKAMEAATDEEPGFKKGGVPKKKRDHEKLKRGGHAEGEMAKMRADKKPRHKRAAGGRTPYTSGHNTSMDPISGKTDRGHEGERPSE